MKGCNCNKRFLKYQSLTSVWLVRLSVSVSVCSNAVVRLSVSVCVCVRSEVWCACVCFNVMKCTDSVLLTNWRCLFYALHLCVARGPRDKYHIILKFTCTSKSSVCMNKNSTPSQTCYITEESVPLKMSRPKGTRGSFHQAIGSEQLLLLSSTISSFQNPFNLVFRILEHNRHTSVFIQWKEGLLSKGKECPHCQAPCTLQKRSKNIDKFAWRCSKNSKHEFSIWYNPFFEGADFYGPRRLLFLKNFRRHDPT